MIALIRKHCFVNNNMYLKVTIIRYKWLCMNLILGTMSHPHDSFKMRFIIHIATTPFFVCDPTQSRRSLLLKLKMSLSRSLVICLVLLTTGLGMTFYIHVYIIYCLFFLAAQNCTHGSLRLLWGQGPFEGNVQICINNTWGWICMNDYRQPDAQVVCRQLGYNGTGE